MRIALTGCSGFIGSVTAQRLVDAGHEVTGLVRSTSRRDHVEPYISRFVEASHDDATAWPDLLDGADCIVHNSVDWAPLKADDLAGHLRSNLNASIQLMHMAAPRQFVFISSVAVHHNISPRWKGLIDTEHPLRPGNLYGAYKAAVEAFMSAAYYGSGQPTCAIRPCAVYGVDPNLSRSIGFPMIQSIQAGEPFTRKGGGKFVHVDDVAESIVECIGNESTYGQAFHLVDCYARWADIARMICEELDVEVEIDTSSPESPKNQFDKTEVQALGIPLDRGHGGLREHIRELIAAMTAMPAS